MKNKAMLILLLIGSLSGALSREEFEVIAHPSAARPAYQTGFPLALNGSHVRYSPVALGDLNNDRIEDIVVGASDGKVHAYTGDGVELWKYDTGDMAIESKTAIADIDQDGWNEVVVASGSTFTPDSHGGLYVLNHHGYLQCSFAPGDFNRDGWQDGIHSSPALADLDKNDQGKLEIAFGGWDAYVRVLNDDCSVVWERFVRDTVWSSPAVGDIDKDGRLDVVVGVDSHYEPAFGTKDGGILHVYDSDGRELAGFPIQIDEVIYSSPVLADINGDDWLEIIVGTGRCWTNPACAPNGRVHPGVGEYLNVWDHNGIYLPGWPMAFDDTYAYASPALADLNGDDLPEVIVNTADGWVHALNADATYVPGWPVLPTTPDGTDNVVHIPTSASPIVADLNGSGYPEVILPSNWELVVWDRGGEQLSRDRFPPPDGMWDLSTEYTISGSPATGDVDGDGDVEIVVGGAYKSTGWPGAVYAWDFPADLRKDSPWSVFRRDSMNNARFPLSPRLSLTQDSLSMLYEYSEPTEPAASIHIENEGEGEITWAATASHRAVSVSPSNGSVSKDPAVVNVSVDGAGFGIGTYDLGAVTVTGSSGSEPVKGSPMDVALTLHVCDEVFNTFLPFVTK